MLSPTTKRAVILLFLAWTIDYVDRTVISAALTSMGTDLSLDHGERGLVVSCFFIAYALAQLPGGMLADRFGALRVAVAGLIAWSVFTGLTALAFSLTSLFVIRFLFGLAQGVFPAAAIKLLSERSRPEERLTANGWVNSSNAFGLVLGLVVAAALLPLVGWRGMFATIAVLGAFMAAALSRRMPAPLAGGADEVTPAGPGVGSLLRVRVLWLYAVVFFGYDFLIWGASAWLPSYLQEERGMSESMAALGALPAGLLSAVAIVACGRYADRIQGRPRPLILPAMVTAAVGVLAIPHIGHTATFIVAFTLVAVAATPAYTGAFSLPLRELDPRVTGVGIGLILVGGMVAGIIAPAAFGAVVSGPGWNAAWALLALGPLTATIAALLLPRTAEAFRAVVPTDLLSPSLPSPPIGADR